MGPKVVHLAVETLFRDSAIGSTGLINGRFLPSLKDVQNIAKSIRARNQMDSNDTRSAEALIGELETTLPGTMLLYQPQTKNSEGNITQPLRLVLSTAFLTRMASPFGTNFAFMTLLTVYKVKAILSLYYLSEMNFVKGCLWLFAFLIMKMPRHTKILLMQ